MARINLLPWRQAERERKNREFLTLIIGVLLLSLLAAFAAWSYFNDTLDSQKQANEKIKQENASLDKALAEIDSLEKQRDEMISRMKVIQDLQGRRPVPVRIWDDIARLIPSQMYLINMKREGDVITFKGKADNPDVVATFIRNLDGSQWLENSAVKSIQQPQATAYQATPTPSPTANAANTQPPRPTYPEDNYVSFEVTTNITQAQNAASATAGTTVTVSSATGGTAISSTSQTLAISSVAPATGTASAVNVTNSAVGSSHTAATPSTPSTTPSANKVVATTTSTATTTTVTKETK